MDYPLKTLIYSTEKGFPNQSSLLVVVSKCILHNCANSITKLLKPSVCLDCPLAISTALQLYSCSLISNLKFKEDINKEVVAPFVVCERYYLVARNKLKRVGG